MNKLDHYLDALERKDSIKNRIEKIDKRFFELEKEVLENNDNTKYYQMLKLLEVEQELQDELKLLEYYIEIN